MSSEVIYFRAKEADIYQLAATMRAEEIQEVYALAGYTPEEALRKSFLASRDAYSAFAGDTILAMFGIRPYSLVSHTASPWLLTSQARANRYSRELLRSSREAIAHWRQDYSLLVNEIDARYTQSIRWAAWLGFTVGEPRPLGILGLPFCRVEIRS